MMDNEIESICFQLYIQIVSVFITSLLGALFLRIAFRWVEEDDITYGTAYITTLIIGLLNTIFSFVIIIIVGSNTRSSNAIILTWIILIPFEFMISSAIIAKRTEISFGKACRVALIMIGMALGICFVFGVILVLGIMLLK
jgi:hypothetical protein